MSDFRDMRKRMIDQQSFAVKQSLTNVEELIKIYQAEKTRRKTIEVANSKIRAIVDSMTDGMLATDGDFKIVEVNQVICKMLEKEKEELIGQELFDVIDLQEFKEKLLNICDRSSAKDRFDLKMIDPVEKVVRISVSKIHDGQGCVLVIHDITTEKRTENLKYEFLSILSHELRTPLTAIQGYTELLSIVLSEILSEEQKEYLEIIDTSTRQMQRIVDDLLQFAHLQSLALESMDQEVHLINIFNEIFLSLTDMSIEKEIQLRIDNEVERPIVTGNYTMLRTAFNHLVMNAIMFGRRNGHVLVKLTQNEQNYQITVADDGIGIPGSELDNVFSSFYQVEEHMNRNQDGLGLGLSIVKRVVNFHHGQIKVKSKLNEGTIFSITLRKMKPDEQ